MIAALLDPRTVMLINLFWTAIIITGCVVSLSAKLVNWRHQQVKNVPSMMFVMMILAIMAANMAAGIIQPLTFTNAANLIANLAYTVYLVWFGMFRCFATYHGSLFAKRKTHVPVMFR